MVVDNVENDRQTETMGRIHERARVVWSAVVMIWSE